MPQTLSMPLLSSMLMPRPQDGHKGTFGHALLIAGSYGMAGASLLAGKSCLRAGAGKLTIHIPRANNDIMQIGLPEAILQHDSNDLRWTSEPFTLVSAHGFSAIAIGPGIGTAQDTAQALHHTLKAVAQHPCPMVLDADALNILAKNPEWFSLLTPQTIITPHPLELRRLHEAGICTDGVILVEKGHRTVIHLPMDKQYICPWGNDGMGTAGSGDTLTGIILGLLAQGYPAHIAAPLGVGLHSLSGDAAARHWGRHSLIASDIVNHLGEAFAQILSVT